MRLGTVVEVGSDAFADQIETAAGLGAVEARLRVAWSSLQPRPGALAGGPVEAVVEACSFARRHGLQPWIDLLRGPAPSLPPWFDDEGGFGDGRLAARAWPRFVDTFAEAVGDHVAGWVPFEAPFALAASLVPADPRRHGEVVDTLVTAWRDAWRVLRGGPPVATLVDLAPSPRPVDAGPQAAAAARRLDQLRWGVWLNALTTGRLVIPGRADREVADLAGACDVLGVGIDLRGGPCDVEALLHRALETGPERPLALTLRLAGRHPEELAEAVQRLRGDVAVFATDVGLAALTLEPLAG